MSFIDFTVAKVLEVDVRLHINLFESSLKKQKQKTFCNKNLLWIGWEKQKQTMLLCWPLNMIVQFCSQRAKTTSSHMSVIISNICTTLKTLKALQISETFFCCYL